MKTPWYPDLYFIDSIHVITLAPFNIYDARSGRRIARTPIFQTSDSIDAISPDLDHIATHGFRAHVMVGGGTTETPPEIVLWHRIHDPDGAATKAAEEQD
jgi:hypothetical protein